MSYKPVNKADVDKVSQALQKMMQEDLTLKAVNDIENHQSLLYAIGDQQLDLVFRNSTTNYDPQESRCRVQIQKTVRRTWTVWSR